MLTMWIFNHRARARFLHVVQRATDRTNRAKPRQMIRKSWVIQHTPNHATQRMDSHSLH